MKKKSLHFTIPIIIALMVTGVAYWYFGSYRIVDKAGEILETTGIKGGLVVHLGCKNGKLTAALHANESYLVHGLAKSRKSAEKARDYIHDQDQYGAVTVEQWNAKKLPYTDNLVSLLVAEDLMGVSMNEVMRVLSPNGVAYVKQDGKWEKREKARPESIDEWTHHLHGPSNNAVANDTEVQPPQILQWKGLPTFSRSHELIPSIQAMVSSDGRIFYIIDEAPLGVKDKRVPSQWKLIARDAYNGVVLWKRPIPGGRSAVSPECLVASGDKVYVTLHKNSEVSVLDGASGQTLQKLPGTKGTKKIIYHDETLVLHRQPENADHDHLIQGMDPSKGDILWEIKENDMVTGSLASTGNRVFFHTTRGIVCVGLNDGEKHWDSSLETLKEFSWGRRGKVVATKDVVLFQNNRHMVALSARDGHLLWEAPGASGNVLFVAQGLVWAGVPEYLNQKLNQNKPLDPAQAPYEHIYRAGGGKYFYEGEIRNTLVETKGYDPLTGEVKKTIKIKNLLSPGHHFRCYPGKATSRYLLWNKRGIEFMDLTGNNHMRHDWLRGMCKLGFMPANGLIYMPPHQCFCYPASQMGGFNAVSGQMNAQRWSKEVAGHPLEKGPAYVMELKKPIPQTEHWPMYRHDNERSGHLTAGVPKNLSKQWVTALGGKLTQPIVVNGNLYISQVNSHRIYCLNSHSGKIKWSFTAGGKVDSSPTYYRGMLFFGAADGWVYALRATDGRLTWRFRGAPYNRRIVACGQLESSWPVHGSVLVKDGVVYCLAGRSSHIDGGMYLFGLDPQTGEQICANHLETPRPNLPEDRGHPFEMEGFRSGLLVSGGDHIYLRRAKFNKKLEQQETQRNTKLGDRDVGRHLFSNTSLLDDSQWDRSYWMYASRWPGYYFGVRAPKSGSILVFNDSVTFANKHYDRETDHSPIHKHGQGNLLYADHNDTEPILVGEEGAPKPVGWLPEASKSLANGEFCAFYHPAVNYEKGPGLARGKQPLWSHRTSVRTRAMALADSLLFVAGPPDQIDPEDPLATFQGRKGAYLHVVSASGEKLATYKLDAPPVFDGLIAAEKKLFMATIDGGIQCLGK